MGPKKTALLVSGLIVLLLLLSSLFTVREGQSALISRLGKLYLDDQEKAEAFLPGLHTQIPFLDRVLKFDVRLQTLDIQSSRIVTAEKKDVIVDYYVKWRISDLPTYYTRTGGVITRAEKLLKQQVNDGLRAEFGRRTIREVVSDERANIMVSLNQKANFTAQKLGMDVLDVRIKRIDLPEEVSNAVFERMRAERERVAREHRAEGRARAEAIRADADAQATIIVATASAQADAIRASGVSEAAKIYSDSYSQDPDFYAFYRSLLAYVQTFDNKNNMLLITPDSQFFSYFNNAVGKKAKKNG